MTCSPSATAPPDAPAPVRETRARPLEETLPPYTVVLHNDDVNSMDHVVHALLTSVPELDAKRAVEVMLTAHRNGQADVISCPLERAELYRDRLEGHGLTATIRR
ncbi:MAG: ATP-dependent Clp protease adaptor ClpS [Dehalococcoidia bacterium]